jgi:type II secretory pathway pseudopilin PulG
MQKLRKFLTQTKRQRNDRGSTMIETVISIPLLALIAGLLAFGMAKSLMVMHDNNRAIVAASTVQKTMDRLQDAQSCYDLQTALNDETLFTVDDSKGFEITHTATDCGADSSVTIHLEAVRTSDSRVIFETTAKNFIQGSGYDASAP